MWNSDLKKKGDKLPAKAPTDLPNGYRPNIDVTGELNGVDSSY